MLIKLKVHPDSRKTALERKADDAFEVWVKAPAENGRANAAALAQLAAALGTDARKLHIVKGATSPSKIVKVYT
ncbi:MAG: DUF167 domain-containing protein [Elusimicrobia bacterium]|nr:DUF167 domain-containing protein [Elusimicrobiota bacterium]